MNARKPLPGELLITRHQLRERIEVIALAGELDMATAPSLSDTINQVNHGTKLILLDLSELTFVDSHGIRLLLRQPAQADLILVRPSNDVRRVLDIVHADLACPITETIDEALAMLQRAAS